MSDKVTLSDAQLNNALLAYAHGKTSEQVIDGLLDAFPDLDGTPATRAMFREQLRCVNPNDKRFSATKYGQAYEMARQAAVDALRSESRLVFRSVVNSLTSNIEDLDVIGMTLQSMLDTASDKDITSNTEFLNTVRTFASLQKVKIEAVNAMSNLIEQLSQLPAFPSDNVPE